MVWPFRRGVKIHYRGGVIGEVTIRCPKLSGFGNVWRFPVYEVTDDYIVIDKGRKILIKRGYYTISRPAEGLPRDFMIIDIYAKGSPVVKGDTIIVEPYHPEAIMALSAVSDQKKLLDVMDEMIKKYNEKMSQMKDELMNTWGTVIEDIHDIVIKVRNDMRQTFKDLIRQELEYARVPGEKLKESYRYFTTGELRRLAMEYLSLIDNISRVISSKLGVPREEIANAIIKDPSKLLEYGEYIRMMRRPRLGIENIRPKGKVREVGKKEPKKAEQKETAGEAEGEE
ncbi:MAG: hypothetical protein DRO39_00900 [Thermoprotei archaeon]|nr:MAG: hypothetical protein DRO39_00900 [Thermoprotei archaeon]